MKRKTELDYAQERTCIAKENLFAAGKSALESKEYVAELQNKVDIIWKELVAATEAWRSTKDKEEVKKMLKYMQKTASIWDEVYEETKRSYEDLMDALKAERSAQITWYSAVKAEVRTKIN